MKAPWATTVLIALSLSIGMTGSAAGQSAAGDSPLLTRTTLVNDFGVELGGHSLIYSFSYQRMVSPLVGLEASVAGLGSGSTSGDGGSALVLGSVGGRLYFVRKNASPFATAGIVFANASTDSGPFSSNSSSSSYGYTGLGFEFRSPSGFVIRAALYGLIHSGDYIIWPGLTVGYAF